MGRQPNLVLLLLLAIGALQIAVTTTTHSFNRVVHDQIKDNELNSDEDTDYFSKSTSKSIKISTPKNKDIYPTLNVATTTNDKKPYVVAASHKPPNDEKRIVSDPIKTSKYHSVSLTNQLSRGTILSHAIKRNNGSETTATNSDDNDRNKSEENYDLDDDDYNYDYYEDYNPDENQSAESTQKSKTHAKNKPNMSPIIASQQKKNLDNVSKLQLIKETEKPIPKSKQKIANDEDDNNMNNNTDNTEDEDDDYDDDEDENEDNDEEDEEDDIADEEEIVFSENVPCPRDCICARNVNSYLVATCSRLDLGKQKFGSDITDLVVIDVGPKYPILLGPDFFVKIGLKHVSTIKIVNCTIEYLHQSAFRGLDALYSVNLTNVGLAIINPDTFANNRKLRLLTITGNDLSIMSSVNYLIKSSSLEELDLSRNNLMELNPNAFSQLTNIVYISLSQNNLQKIPEVVFNSLDTLEELDLSYNSLKILPPTVFNQTALAILRLSYNEITGDLRFGTNDLQQLDLSFNSIKQIHHSMFDKMPGLTKLILKGNGITKIQADSFLTLKNLRNIDLSINELDQVSSLLFYKNSELSEIRLNDNPRLSQLPTDGFQSYTGYFPVNYMDISNCAIGALGLETFVTMPRLTTLKLAWNNINNLERDTFATLTQLNELDLSNNLIMKLDDLMFENNNDLTILNLAGNPIRKLSIRLFLPFDKLTHLDVSECELHSLISDNHYGAKHNKYRFYETLHTLNASANQIKKLSSADVRNFKVMRTLDVSHNPLKCNEDFQDFIAYVSLNTHILPHKDLPLKNLETDAGLRQFQAQEGWVKLAREVCKHQAHPPTDQSRKDSAQKRVDNIEEDLDEDTKNLLDITDSKSKKMSTILKDTRKNKMLTENKQKKDEIENDLNKNYEKNIISEGKDNENNDEDENMSDYDDDDEEEEEEEDEDEETDEDGDGENGQTKNEENIKGDSGSFDKKKTDKINMPVIHGHGIKVQEIELSNGENGKMLINKFLLNGEDTETNDDTEEIIIERGHIYYSGFKFLIPAIVIVICMIIMLLIIAKIVTMVMRKRGERYRMALLASSKNSIVYQKLSEDIKPVAKESKQPKVHRYAPINQV